MAKIIKQIDKIFQISDLTQNLHFNRRVAIYARVSTSKEEQLNSLEAQKDYYAQYIAMRPNFTFVEMYVDEGISGLKKEHRIAFNKMMNDASLKKFDLILTKSISRFARNTVDTLSCIRKLKDYNIEVFFEKENIWTFDSKGEFVLTLLSSLAQEESRSMSENIKWGKRKQFMNGKYSVAYSQFLGYDKGMQINEQQAMIVRYIYKLFLEGYPPSSIATQLISLNIPSPMDYKHWYASTVLSILTNEKYKGDALLQKSFTNDYLTKKVVINKGELPQYYVTDGHDPIIPRETFDYTQKVYSIYKKIKNHTFISALSQKLICNSCGQYYRRVNAYTGCYWVCKNHNLVAKCNSVRFRGDVIDYLLHAAITILFHKYLNQIKSFLPIHLQHFKLTKMIYPFEIVHLILDKVIAFRNYDLTFRFINGTEITLSGWNATRKIAPKTMNIHRIPPSI